MKIHEYQAKQILKEFGAPTPRGAMAETTDAAVAAAGGFRMPVVVKAQVHVGGRGKAGGVKLARSLDEVRAAAQAILGMDIKGCRVRKILVEEAADIRREIYLGFIVDRARQAPVLMGSAEGGVEIEEVAAKTPEKILMLPIRPRIGLADFQIRRMAGFLGLTEKAQFLGLSAILRALYAAFVSKDCSLAEINPLVVEGNGNVLACDAKMNFDDNALYRQPDVAAMRDVGEEEPLETRAREQKLSYVKLDGRIGCLVNGAGLAMGTMDVVKRFGGEPANFLDIGGGARPEQVAEALRIITSDPSVNTILFNIFGGIVRCDRVAEGILAARDRLDLRLPIVIRLSGTNAKKARRMLKGTAFIMCETMSEAAQKAVEMSRRMEAI
jgi:succinyl-CoA synthetase beta subunit